MRMTLEGIRDTAAWEKAQVKLPGFDVEAMRKATEEAPVWVHFGAGNIFRGPAAAAAAEGTGQMRDRGGGDL